MRIYYYRRAGPGRVPGFGTRGGGPGTLPLGGIYEGERGADFRRIRARFLQHCSGSNVEECADSSEREIGDSCEREIRAVGVILFPTGKS